jgi:inhibitor of cysteine peptidase
MTMARRTLTFRPAIILVLVTIGACSSSGSASPAVTLGVSCNQFTATPNVQQSTRIEVGATVAVGLCANPTTGYSWATPTISDPAVVEVVSSVYQGPAEASPPVVGASGQQVITLRAKAPGAATVSVGYGQPWAGGEKDAWTYDLVLTVP